jgi:hypothetical protein
VGFNHCLIYKTSLPLKSHYNLLYTSCRYYSTSNSSSRPLGYDSTPIPIITLDLNDRASIKSHESILKGKGGIYSLVNTVNGKQYIGSAKDFYIRLNQHLKYKNNSNAALQKAFIKYGVDKFKIYIYEYFTYESKIISHMKSKLAMSGDYSYNFSRFSLLSVSRYTLFRQRVKQKVNLYSTSSDIGLDNKDLNPNFVTGLMDAESSFTVSVHHKSKLKIDN